jgi:hypothetical protein
MNFPFRMKREPVLQTPANQVSPSYQAAGSSGGIADQDAANGMLTKSFAGREIRIGFLKNDEFSLSVMSEWMHLLK